MYTSKATQRLLGGSGSGPRNAKKGPATDSVKASLGLGPAPNNPVGTTAPSSRLPVRHKRLSDDPEPAAPTAGGPIPSGNHLDEPMPMQAAYVAANNELASRASRTDIHETVVRSAESPLLYGPIGTRYATSPIPTGAPTAPPPPPAPYTVPSAPVAAMPAKTSGTPTHTSPPTFGRRSQATPPPRPPSQTQPSARPGSATTAAASGVANPALGVTTKAEDGPQDFAAELEDIGRQHKSEARSRHRAALAQAKALRESLSGGPAPGLTSTSAMQATSSSTANVSGGVDASRYESVENVSAQTGLTGAATSPTAPGSTEDPEGDDEAQERRTATGKPLHVLYTPDIRAKLPPGTAAHTHVQPKPMTLRDYEMIAEACQRAGRARTESHAYYKIGELLSAKPECRAQAVEFFKRYLNLARRLNDLQGEAKALNCLGVVHFELGGPANFQAALEYNQQHAAIADAAGVFIAHTNMGLVYRRLGDNQASVQCFRNTLKYAVRAGDRAAESLALANLGAAGAAASDFVTARVCVERHLELSATLQDNASAVEAHEHLGTLAAQRGDFNTASTSYSQALETALREGDHAKAKALRCQIGVVHGLLKAEQAMSSRATNMGAGSLAM